MASVNKHKSAAAAAIAVGRARTEGNGKLALSPSGCRFRPTGSSPSDPLVPFQVWKIRRSTVERLKEAAVKRGQSTAGLVRKLLDDWAAREQAKIERRRLAAKGLR